MPEYATEVDPLSLQILEAVTDAAYHANVSWVITGAMARRLVFEGIHGQAPGRRTHDWDLGVQVADWSQLAALEARLVADAGFESDPRQRQRMRAPGGGVIDLIPFGGVEGERHVVDWGDDGGFELNVAGFRQAFEHACRVRLNDRVTVRVVPPAGLAMLKLIAWRDRHQEHDRDAEDLAFLLSRYPRLIADEVHERHAGIMADEDYDLDCAGARVLGREAAELAGPSLRTSLAAWLSDELAVAEESRLVVTTARYLAGRGDGQALALLQAFERGWRA